MRDRMQYICISAKLSCKCTCFKSTSIFTDSPPSMQKHVKHNCCSAPFMKITKNSYICIGM